MHSGLVGIPPYGEMGMNVGEYQGMSGDGDGGYTP
jgi:hypothetical protein